MPLIDSQQGGYGFEHIKRATIWPDIVILHAPSVYCSS